MGSAEAQTDFFRFRSSPMIPVDQVKDLISAAPVSQRELLQYIHDTTPLRVEQARIFMELQGKLGKQFSQFPVLCRSLQDALAAVYLGVRGIYMIEDPTQDSQSYIEKQGVAISSFHNADSDTPIGGYMQLNGESTSQLIPAFTKVNFALGAAVLNTAYYPPGGSLDVWAAGISPVIVKWSNPYRVHNPEAFATFIERQERKQRYR